MLSSKRSRYSRSQKLFAAASRILPGGVDSPVRAFKSVGGTPLFIARASGARIEDADGHTYIDYVMSWGPLHPRACAEGAAESARGRGGARHELRRADGARDAAGAAGRDADAVDGARPVRQLRHRGGDERDARRARGDEARQDRQVRGVLSRPRGRVPRAGRLRRDDARRPDQPRRAGRGGAPTRCSRATTISRRSKRSSTRHRGQIAAIIVEPIAGNMGVVPPRDGFLQGLRAICDRDGILLVFDEVISGFRAAAGGAQQVFGVRPDLTCLGKIIGGGLPVGAYGGRADVMELVAPAGPVYQAGTLSGNPLAMTAGLWSLSELSPKLYRHLAKLGAQLAGGLADAAREAGVAMQVNAFGSLVTPFFTTAAGPRLRVGAAGGHGHVWEVLPRDAGARCVSAAVPVRGLVPLRRAHREGRGEHHQGGSRRPDGDLPIIIER